LKIIFARDEVTGNLTRVVDDTYHPDMMDAVLYAFRSIWTTYPDRKPKPTELVSSDPFILIDREKR
jgi:hypothetical protein